MIPQIEPGPKSTVSLDREEESDRKIAQTVATDAREELRRLLWRTRLRDLDPAPPATIAPSASVALASARMRQDGTGCLLAVGADGRLVGICTERDVLYRVAGADRRASAVRVEEIMTPGPATLRGGHHLAQALNLMSADHCWHVPIVDEAGIPTGVLSVRRIVDFLLQQFPQELLNLPPDPDQKMAKREGG